MPRISQSPKDRIQSWLELAGIHKQANGSPDDLHGFLGFFRPDGRGLADVFRGVERGDELAARLREVFRATAPGYRPSDIYAEVRRPAPIADRRLIATVRKYLHAARAMTNAAYGDVNDESSADLIRRIAGPWRIEIRRERLRRSSSDPLVADIATAATDFILGLEPIPSDGSLLDEALYSLAASYDVVYYVLWPLYRDSTNLKEPFRPAFVLWKHGVQLRFLQRARTLRAYCGRSGC